MKFLASGMAATRVNLIMNDHAAGLPSPMAFLGLAEAIGRSLGLAPWSAAVLPILHEVAASNGRTKPEMQPKSGRFVPTETMEDMTGLVRFSLLLDLPGWTAEDAVRQVLLDRRLAGGTIAGDPVVKVASSVSDGTALTAARRGWVLLRPAGPERRAVSRGEEASLSAIAALLFPPERGAGFGWPVPVAVGHHLLEDPATAPRRSGVRDPSLPHVFTEPVLGIAEFVSVRNAILTDTSPEAFDNLFWRWHARGRWILAHPAYHPES